jgi:hypothetical protein
MRGKGSPFFAVWGYVISHMRPDRKPATEMQVDLNPEIIAFLLGEKEEVVAAKISEMCKPDLKSRTPDLEGRKLVKLGEYTYTVVNGLTYRRIRNEEERNEYQRVKQAEYREKRAGRRRRPANPMHPMASTTDKSDGGAARIARAEDVEEREKEIAIAAEGLKP